MLTPFPTNIFLQFINSFSKFVPSFYTSEYHRQSACWVSQTLALCCFKPVVIDDHDDGDDTSDNDDYGENNDDNECWCLNLSSTFKLSLNTSHVFDLCGLSNSSLFKMMIVLLTKMKIFAPGQDQDVVFDKCSVEPEVERTLLVILWHLRFGRRRYSINWKRLSGEAWFWSN